MLMLNDIIGMDHKSYNLAESTHLRHLVTNCVVFYTVTCTKFLSWHHWRGYLALVAGRARTTASSKSALMQ
jgi:hypothetical protein